MTRLHLSSDQYSFLAEDPNRPYTLGRLNECQFLVADITVSRRHAEVFCRGANWFVRDLGSKHGISVNGVSVKTVQLNGGDQLRLGGLALAVRLLAEGEAAPPPPSPAPARALEVAQVRASSQKTAIMRAPPAPPNAPASAPAGAAPSAPPSAPASAQPSAAPGPAPDGAAKAKSRLKRLRQRRIRR